MYHGLTDRGRARSTDRAVQLVDVGEYTDLAAEAREYTLLNGGGTPQTAEEMANAARIAGSRPEGTR